MSPSGDITEYGIIEDLMAAMNAMVRWGTDGHAYYITSNGIPQRMPRAIERKVRKAATTWRARAIRDEKGERGMNDGELVALAAIVYAEAAIAIVANQDRADRGAAMAYGDTWSPDHLAALVEEWEQRVAVRRAVKQRENPSLARRARP